MLTQIRTAGQLHRIAGIIAGPAVALSLAFAGAPAFADPEVPATPGSSTPATGEETPAPAPPADPAPGEPAPVESTPPAPTPADPTTPPPPAPPQDSDDGSEKNDSALTIDGPSTFVPGELTELTVAAKSTTDTDYVVNVNLPDGLTIEDVPPVDGWQLKVKTPQRLEAIHAETQVKNPLPVSITVTATDGVEREGSIKGTLVAPPFPDADPANNTVSLKAVIEGAGTIKGLVWHDVDRDGRQGAEPTVPGTLAVLFSLAGEGPEAVADAETGPDGRYAFSHQPLGEYGVAIVAPDGTWSFTKANVGDDAKDSDVAVPDDEDAAPELTSDTATKGLRKRLGAKAAAEDEEGEFALSTDIVTVDGRADQVVDAGLVKGSAPAPGTGGSLPVTGASVGVAVGAGLLLLVGGAGLVYVTRRRRTATAAL